MSAKYLLVSDLDDTLLGDGDALRRFREFYQSIQSHLGLVYASGRFFDSVKEDILSGSLPEPEWVIGGVGSEICRYPDGERDQEWISRMSENWSAEKVRELLKDDDRLCIQPEKYQSGFKVSYFFHDATQGHLEDLEARLNAKGIAVNLIYSSNRDLDVLPHCANKGTAAEFLADRLGYPSENVLAAGNSGNDAALMQHGFKGIVVANAHDELKQKAGDLGAFLASRPLADGVVDGIQHWVSQNKA